MIAPESPKQTAGQRALAVRPIFEAERKAGATWRYRGKS